MFGDRMLEVGCWMLDVGTRHAVSNRIGCTKLITVGADPCVRPLRIEIASLYSQSFPPSFPHRP